MRKIPGLFALACLSLSWGCSQSPAPAPRRTPELIARYHFVGSGRLAGNTNAARFSQIWSLAATAALREQTLQKLARAGREFLCLPPGGTNAGQATLLRPLLDDLIQAESLAEWRGPTHTPVEFALAVRLDDARANVWQTRLREFVSTAAGAKSLDAPIEGFPGWEVRISSPAGLFRFTRAGEWIVLGSGRDPLRLQSGWVQQIKTSRRPAVEASNYWLQVESDLARLAPSFALSSISNLPLAQLSVIGKGENLRANARLLYPQTLDWKYEAWRVPTNIIRDPLTGFTAIQGIAPLLGQMKLAQQLDLKPPPNQLYVWANTRGPFQSFAGAPMRNPSASLLQMSARATATLNSNIMARRWGRLDWDTNRSELVWSGLPIVSPTVRVVREPAGDFLFGSLFPMIRSTNPAPAALMAQVLGRNNLVYYDWEITEDRINYWTSLGRLLTILMPGLGSPTNALAAKWLEAVAPRLGNTVTEVTVAGSQELRLARTSQLGFAGLELAFLTRWLEAPEFPRLDSKNLVRPAWDRTRMTQTNRPPAKAASRPPEKPASNPPPKR